MTQDIVVDSRVPQDIAVYGIRYHSQNKAFAHSCGGCRVSWCRGRTYVRVAAWVSPSITKIAKGVT